MNKNISKNPTHSWSHTTPQSCKISYVYDSHLFALPDRKLLLRSIASARCDPAKSMSSCLCGSALTFRVTARGEQGVRRSEEVRQVPGETFHLSFVCFPLGGSFPTIRAAMTADPDRRRDAAVAPWMRVELRQHPKHFSRVCQGDVLCILTVHHVFLPEGRRVELFSWASVGRGDDEGSYTVTWTFTLSGQERTAHSPTDHRALFRWARSMTWNRPHVYERDCKLFAVQFKAVQ